MPLPAIILTPEKTLNSQPQALNNFRSNFLSLEELKAPDDTGKKKAEPKNKVMPLSEALKKDNTSMKKAEPKKEAYSLSEALKLENFKDAKELLAQQKVFSEDDFIQSIKIDKDGKIVSFKRYRTSPDWNDIIKTYFDRFEQRNLLFAEISLTPQQDTTTENDSIDLLSFLASMFRGQVTKKDYPKHKNRIISSIKQKDVNVLNSYDADGDTLLHIALKAILKQPNADPIAHQATKIIHEIIVTLIARQVDVNAKDKTGKTPLHLISQSTSLYSPHILGLLLEMKADPNCVDSNMDTPLHHLCHQDPNPMFQGLKLRLLLKKGARYDLKNKLGKTSSDLILGGQKNLKEIFQFYQRALNLNKSNSSNAAPTTESAAKRKPETEPEGAPQQKYSRLNEEAAEVLRSIQQETPLLLLVRGSDLQDQ